MSSPADGVRARAAVFSKWRPRPVAKRGRKGVASAVALALIASLAPAVAGARQSAFAAPVGQGFNLNAADLGFILDQIKIAERHAATATADNPCGTLIGSGPNQIPAGPQAVELPLGLRTVDGTCNNLVPGQEKWGAADQTFPRRVDAQFMGAEDFDPDGPGPAGARSTSYAQTSGDVADSRPRTISNLVVDQTNNNPAAVAAAGADPAAEKSDESLFIPNVATDVGLSAPYNSVFTLFGQFFDHGLDLFSRGSSNVYIPLKPDDPLYREGSRTNFMVITRAANQPGPDGELGTEDDIREATNLTTPFVDQNQTYTSHPSQQVFVREYTMTDGRPTDTGRLIEGAAPRGGQATWAEVKTQAREKLGIQLRDADVLNVPLLATDPYGNFEPGPNGLPQIVLQDGSLREGNLAAPVNTDGAVVTGHAFLDDIAHSAAPRGDANPADGPGPVVDLTPDADTDTGNEDGNPATYDDEMLDAHFIAGDGRVNENIGLTSIHQVFHSEHNRLAGDIDELIASTGQADAWRDTSNEGAWSYGQRIFQAAKFVTEMEYQHLVFEEFARKVQPMVNAFGEGGMGYNTEVNPAIMAEYAHSVYRFGHSMLTETVARRNVGGGRNDIPLIQAFLNPPSFTDGGAAGQLNAAQAAGSVFRGMSRQVGNEIDEFVTGALRSNLLGLPLDLATINMARARETGVPSLNEARRAFYNQSNNSALKPYTSWVDFSFNLKHRESLVNFVAAYGTHPLVASESTVAGKRDAAVAIVHGAEGPDGVLADLPETPVDEAADNPTAEAPADRGAFLDGSGSWAGQETGLNQVDLWVGGLAEKRMVFGGMLGSTFNYIFEMQLENLQFGDRFYYLSRTAGMNLLTQLEGNSFAELIMRNTDVDGLPADVFSRPDFVFNMDRIGHVGGPIVDDPTTEDDNEADRSTQPGVDLHWLGDGTLRYTGPAHTVFNGTAGGDRMWASEGDDTMRGNDGDDWIQGGDGVDNLIGGLGDDRLEDDFGDDTIKGGDGNDYISSGQGFGADLNQGGRGSDFVHGGNDMTETFAGPGDDFVFAGDSEDTVFGDDGDDWIEGGDGPFNLLQGDNGNPFQNDPDGGHDVIDGNGGEQDFDAEGGDDIMLMGPGIQRSEGMLGFDWTTHQGDPRAGDSDMRFTGLLPPSLDALRDRFDLVEALSGWDQNDVLRGDDRTSADIAGGHELTAAGVNRISGLAELLGGATTFDAGNILIGGAGSDTIEGRGGDDVIDGDAWLNVQLSAPDIATADTTDRKLFDNLGQLVGAVRDGRINPADIRIERTIRTAPAGTDVDTAVFSEVRANYDISTVDGVTTIAHSRGSGVDGTDRLTNVEAYVFADDVAPAAPTAVSAVAGNQSATVSFAPPNNDTITGFNVRVVNAAGTEVGGQLRTAPADATSLVVTGLTNGTAYRFQVQAVNARGAGPFSALSNAVTPGPQAPGAPTIGSATAGNQQATVRWTAPADNGGSEVTGYQVRVLDLNGNQVGALRAAGATATSLVVTGLTNGTSYQFQVRAVNVRGNSPYSGLSNVVRPATVPRAPVIGTASSGAAGGAVNATARWTPPTNTGGSPITGYQVRALRMNANGTVRSTTDSAVLGAGARSLVMALPAGQYRFRVSAFNAVGEGPLSNRSNLVTAR